tara:strand:+ start:817 stop:1017 length:201 start_codon:yes stop_codon:yes gene_type:complete
MKKETRKYIPPYASLTFDEVWLAEDELWDISLKESKKQKEERINTLDERKRKLSKKILPYENTSKT